MLEWFPATPPNVTSMTDDPVSGTHTVHWEAAPGKMYRVQKSADGVAWDSLITVSRLAVPPPPLFFEDRLTPRPTRAHNTASFSNEGFGSKYVSILLGIAAGLSLACAAVGAAVIAEFLADNDLGLRDEDGNDEDWIEIHNPDSTAVDLAGWHLTDDPHDLANWTFRPRVLEGNARLIVFASNKDRAGLTGNLHTISSSTKTATSLR